MESGPNRNLTQLAQYLSSLLLLIKGFRVDQCCARLNLAVYCAHLCPSFAKCHVSKLADICILFQL